MLQLCFCMPARGAAILATSPKQHATTATTTTAATTTSASTRALSPGRSSLPRSPLPRMPSPRSSPAIRPSSPLSPGYKGSQFDTLQPPSPRNMHSHHRTSAGNSGRRINNASLNLPSLPRFHPANYPSANSSLQATPDAPSPNGPVSPRAHQRMLSDAQKQLYLYQREMVSVAQRAGSPGEKPASPRLVPLGSPGPVTPLELEGGEGYLVAGAKSSGKVVVAGGEADFVEKIIREEAARRGRPGGSGNAEDRAW